MIACFVCEVSFPLFYLCLVSNAEAVPKRILELMNVDKLTRENVASHLQAQILLFPASGQYDLGLLFSGSLLSYSMFAEI